MLAWYASQRWSLSLDGRVLRCALGTAVTPSTLGTLDHALDAGGALSSRSVAYASASERRATVYLRIV